MILLSLPSFRVDPPTPQRAAKLSPSPTHERLFAFAEVRPVGPGLVGVLLPSGRTIALLRSAAEHRTLDSSNVVAVSPGGGFVACEGPDRDVYAVWVVDVRKGGIRRLATLGRGPCEFAWPGENLLRIAQGGRVRGFWLGPDGWRATKAVPAVGPDARLQAALHRIQHALDGRESQYDHRDAMLSPDGKLVATWVGRSGGPVEDPGPIQAGDVEWTLVAYDRRTLSRRIVGFTWEQKAYEPLAHVFMGWVGGSMALLGPRNGVFTSGLALIGPKGLRSYRLPGTVGNVWSLQGPYRPESPDLS